MSTTSDLLEGIAGIIAGAGLGIKYTPDAVYADGDTGIVMKNLAAKPDRLITLTWVPQGDDITLPDGQGMVQVRGRGLPGNPLDVDNLLDSVFPLLHGATGVALGSVFITQMNRRVSVPMGMDDAKRWMRADQYYLDLGYPGTALRPTGGSW